MSIEEEKKNSSVATILLIHGLGANPDKYWFPWFKEEFEKDGYQVLMPDLSACGLNFGLIFEKLQESVGQIETSKLILVGHSLGAVIVLKLAEKLLSLSSGLLSFEIQKLILIAPASEHNAKWFAVEKRFGTELINLARKNFGKIEMDFTSLKERIAQKVVYLSKDDPYLDFEKTLEDYEALGFKGVFFESMGHFSESVKQFPEIKEAINN